MDLKLVTLADLSEFHRKKVLTNAREWRLNNHKQILDLIKNRTIHQLLEKPHPPIGYKIFDPTKWDALNWMWFSEIIQSQLLNSSNSI